MKKIALITGATSGIGLACAKKLAAAGYNLIITGRREARLHQLESQIRSEYGVEVRSLVFDIRSWKQTQKAIDELEPGWKAIDLLINNAGLAAGLHHIHEGELDHWERMIDTNIKGLLYISRLVAPLMVERRMGHIINIGSVAGKEVIPKANVYSATKHAVDAITKGMRIDLVPYGIKVTQVAPGAVETEFSVVRFDGDHQRASDVYKGFKPLTPGDIADIVYYVTTLPAHVNINDIVVMPVAQASAMVFHKE